MKKTNRLSRLLAMLLALAMLVNSQGMTSMAAVIGGVAGGRRQTEAPQTEAVQTETEAQTEAEQTETAAQTEAVTEAPQTETAAQTETELKIEPESEPEGLAPAETEAVTEAVTESGTEAATEAVTETETETETELETEEIVEDELDGVYTYEDDAMIVTATLTDPSAVPAGAVFVVEEKVLTDEEKALVEEQLGGGVSTYNYTAYDMHFELDGEEIELAEGSVAVSVEYKEAVQLATEEVVEPTVPAIEESAAVQSGLVELVPAETPVETVETEYKVLHLDESMGEVQAEDVTDNVDVAADGKVEEVGFTTDSFSTMIFLGAETVSEVAEPTFKVNVKTTIDGEGFDLKEGMLTFTLDETDKAGNIMSWPVATHREATNDENGDIVFEQISLDETDSQHPDASQTWAPCNGDHDHYFVVKENPIQSIAGLTHDPKEYMITIHVSVAKDSDGNIIGKTSTIDTKVFKDPEKEKQSGINTVALKASYADGADDGIIFVNKFEDVTFGTEYGYTIENLLRGYNVISLGQAIVANHTVGAIMVAGNLYTQEGEKGVGVAGGQLDSGDITTKPSYVGGKVECNWNYAGANNTNQVMPVYVGSSNDVTNNYGNQTLNGNYFGNHGAKLYVSDTYVDFTEVKNVFDAASDYLQLDSETIVPDSSILHIPGGKNVTVSSMKGVKEVIIEGDISATTNTVVNILDKGTVYLPHLMVGTFDADGSDQDGAGSSIVWNIPNASTVYVGTAEGDSSTYGWAGHVLAHNADVRKEGSQYAGTLIGRTVVVKGEGHSWPYNGGGLIPTDGDFQAEKTVDNADPTTEFEFTMEQIKAPDGAAVFGETEDEPMVRTRKNNGRKIDFGSVDYTVAGNYYYIIEEKQTQTTEDGKKYVYDTTKYLVHVYVGSHSDAQNNTVLDDPVIKKYKITGNSSDRIVEVDDETYYVTEVNTVSFNNEKVKKGRLYIDKKVAVNGVVTDTDQLDEYSPYIFEIQDEKGNLKETVRVTITNGKAVSNPPYVELDEGTYYVRELLTEEQKEAGISLLDGNDVEVTVTAGQTEKVETNTAEFTNNKTVGVPAEFKVSKEFKNGNENTEFTVALKAKDGTKPPMPDVTTVTVSENKGASFGQINYSEEGDYYYEVSEENKGEDGVKYDGTVYEVWVHVSKNGANGELSAAVKYREQGKYENPNEGWQEATDSFTFNFTNEQLGRLSVTKTVVGIVPEGAPNIYTVTVTPTDNSIDMSAVTVTKDGEVVTGAPEATVEKGSVKFTFKDGETVTLNNMPKGDYVVKEETSDSFITKYSVTESSAETGATVHIKGNEQTVRVTNTYPSEVSASFKGTKALANGNIAEFAGKFGFKIELTEVSEGLELTDAEFAAGKNIGTNDASGSFEFGPVTFKKAGVYTFTVTETSTNDDETLKNNNIEVDTKSYQVKVTVALNEDRTAYEVTGVEYLVQDAEDKWVEMEAAARKDDAGAYILPSYTLTENDENITATFINKVTKGSLKIKKAVEPITASGTFRFMVSQTVDNKTVYYQKDGTQITDETRKKSAIYELIYPSEDGDEPSLTFENLEPGTYTVTEVDEDGDPVADDEYFPYEVTYSGDGVVAAGETAEVTVTNKEVKGQIDVTKTVKNIKSDDNTKFHVALFTVAADGTETMVEDSNRTISNGGTVNYTDLVPGRYAVYEVVQDPETEAWTKLEQGSISGNYVVTDNGETVELTTNIAKEGKAVEIGLVNTYDETSLKLKGHKVAENIEAGQYTFQLFQLANGGNETLVAKGNYKVEEGKTDTSFKIEDAEHLTYKLEDLGADGTATFYYLLKELKRIENDKNIRAEGTLYYDEKENVYYDLSEKHIEVQVGLKRADGETGEITGIEIQSVKIDGGSPVNADSEGVYDLGSAGTFTNFKADRTHFAIPVQKKIEGPYKYNEEYNKTFTFTLKPADGELAAAYTKSAETDEYEPFTEGTVTISASEIMAGAPKAHRFADLYFEKEGTYTFTLTEAELAVDNINGFTRDLSEYEIVIKVVLKDQQLVVETATWQQTKGRDGKVVSGAKLNDFLNEEGTVVTTPEFTNKYSVEPTDTTLSVKKVVETQNGVAANPDKEFTFRLTAGLATSETGETIVPYYKNDTASEPTAFTSEDVTLKAGGQANFSDIIFQAAGTYTFTMEELVEGETEPGWEMDTKKYHITVVVEDINGQLTVKSRTYTVDESAESQQLGDAPLAGVVTFTNTYGVVDTKAGLKVKKEITRFAKPQHEKEFTFEMTASEDNTGIYGIKDETVTNATENEDLQPFGTQTVTVTDEGEASFHDVTYRTPGTYYYTLKEQDLPDSGYDGYGKDDTEYTIKVVVDDEDGQLKATTWYKKSSEDDDQYQKVEGAIAVTFTNTYTFDAAEFVAGVEKKTTGLPDDAEEKRTFRFEMKAAEDEGAYGFKSYDPENGYTEPIAADELIETVEIEGAGKSSFPKIYYSTAGTYTYIITEQAINYKGYTFDSSEYIVTVTVTEKEDSSLTTSASYVKKGAVDQTPKQLTLKDGVMVGVEFDNTYEAAPTELRIPVKKTTEGISDKKAEGKTFTFGLFDKNNTQIDEATVTIGENGEGVDWFDTLLYAANEPATQEAGELYQGGSGSYTYTVRELTAADGFTKSTDVYTVTVTVTDDGSGQLAKSVTVTTPGEEVLTEPGDAVREGDIAFVNTYSATGKGKVEGKKSVSVKGAKLKTFSFGIYEDEKFKRLLTTNVIANVVTNDTDGNFAFDFEYTMADLLKASNPSVDAEDTEVDAEDEYLDEIVRTYYIREQEIEKDAEGKDIKGYTKDTAVYKVTVTVTDTGNGGEDGLEVATKLEKKLESGEWEEVTPGIASFENDYHAHASWKLGGAKTIKTVKGEPIELTLERIKTLQEKVRFELQEWDEKTNDYVPVADQSVPLGDDGKFRFNYDGFKYDEDDIDQTYRYRVVEKWAVEDPEAASFDKSGYEVDGTAYTFDVAVTDNEDGTLHLSITKTTTPKSGTGTTEAIEIDGDSEVELYDLSADFVNTYDATGDVSFETRKAINGRELKDRDTFTFKVRTVETTTDEAGNVEPVLDENGKPVLGGYVEVEGEQMSATAVVTPGDGQGAVMFSRKIPYTLADAGKTYYYAIVEDVPADNEKAGGITYDTDPVLVKVTVTDDGDGGLNVKKEFYGTKQSFVNDYAANGSISLETKKELVGRDLKAGEFTFEITHIYQKEGAEESEIWTETVQNLEDGSVVFADEKGESFFTYGLDEVGTHTYTVKELEPEGETEEGQPLGGVEYDNTLYTVTVMVSDHGDGTLDIVVEGDAEAAAGDTTGEKYELVKKDDTGKVTKKGFTNNYTAEGSIKLTASKTLNGRKLKDGEFGFVITHKFDAEDGSETVFLSRTVKNSAAGVVDFGELAYTLADVGEHTYNLREIWGSLEGVTYDDTLYTVTVTVSDHGDGTLDIVVEGDAVAAASDETGKTYELVKKDDTVTKTGFTNDYTTKAQTGVELEKKLVGMLGSTFQFELERQDGEEKWQHVATVSNDADGKVDFSEKIVITLEQLIADAGISSIADITGDINHTYNYRVHEIVEAENEKASDDDEQYMTYDKEYRTFSVTAHYDYESGELTLTPSEIEGNKTFTNTWTAEDSIPFRATKVLKNLDLIDENGKTRSFHFEVYDLTNVEGDAQISANEDGSFAIPNGAVKVLEKDSDENGAVDLGSIKYTLDDIKTEDGYQPETYFRYAVIENVAAADKQDSITYDPAVKYVTVKVTYTATSGDLKAEIVDETDLDLTFTNTYSTSASVSVTGEKKLVGKTLDSNMFQFAIYNADDVETIDESEFNREMGETVSGRTLRFKADPIRTVWNTDSAFTFENFKTYMLDDMMVDGVLQMSRTFHYTVVEVKPEEDAMAGVSYDDHIEDVTVTVSYDRQSGVLIATASPDADGLSFTNTYDTSDEVTLDVRKTMEGRDLTDDYGFSFNVYEADAEGSKLSETPLTTGSTKSDGSIKFAEDAITIGLSRMWNEETESYGAQKDFYYLVEEESDNSKDNVTYAAPQLRKLTANYNEATGELTLGWTEVSVKQADGTWKQIWADGRGSKSVPAADTAFTNKYTTSAEAELKGTKYLEGRKLTDRDVYSFEVYREEDVDVETSEADESAVLTKHEGATPVLTGKNDANGKITFTGDHDGKLHYELEQLAVEDKATGKVTYEPKDFTYWVVEVVPDEADESITYDRGVKKVTVHVSYNSVTGVMSAKVTEGTNLTFTNKYTTQDGIGLHETKEMTGRELTDGDRFEFKLEDRLSINGRKTVVDGSETAVNDGKTITFADNTIIITLEDMADAMRTTRPDGIYQKYFRYTLTESDTRTVAGVKNDSKVMELTLLATYDWNEGTLEVKWLNGTEEKSFINDYDATGSLEFRGLKTVNVGAATGKIDLTAERIAELNQKIKFELQRLDEATNEYVTIADSTEITATGSFGFTFRKGESVSYTEDNIGDEYTYKIVEVPKDGVTDLGGYGIDKTEHIYKVKIADSATHDGHLRLTVTDGAGKTVNAAEPIRLTFNNSYDAKGSTKFEVTKVLTGRDMEKDEFIFEVHAVDADGKMEEAVLTVKDADGNEVALRATNPEGAKGGEAKIVFPEIPYTLADAGKTFYYEIVEARGNAGGVTYDEGSVLVKVTVTDDGDGALDVQQQILSANKGFTNTYEATGKASIDGTKTLRGRQLKAGEFTFQVKNAKSGMVVGTGTNDADGKFSFEFVKDRLKTGQSVLFDQDDIGQTFVYELSEVPTEGNNFDFDNEVFTLTVTVKDKQVDGKSVGELEITVTADKPDIEFVNDYTAKGEATLEANKTLTGERKGNNAFADDEFTFTAKLMNTDEKPAESLVKDSYSGKAKSSGTVAFDEIEFTEKDAGKTYIFKIEENEIDETESGKVSKSNAKYYAKIVVGAAEGEATDTKVTELETTVTYHSEVSCTEENQIDISKVSFINEYHATGNVTFDVWKKLNGRTGKDLQEGEFTFKVAEMYGDDVVWLKGVNGLITATNDADGHVQFPEGMVPYNQNDQGTHIYRIYEVIPQTEDNKVGGVSYDSGYVEVTVTVTDENGDGTLTVSEPDYTYHDKDGRLEEREFGKTFINEYEANGTAGFTGVKTVSGNRADEDLTGEFTFQVYEKVKDAQGNETERPTAMTGATDADGSIVFTPAQFTYTQDDIGTHTYVIREDEGEDESISYTADAVTVTVEVTDTGNGGAGALETKVNYPQGGMKFVNDYVANGGITFKGHKELTGNRGEVNNDSEFTFAVNEVKRTETGADEAFVTETRTEVARVSGGANDDFTFPEIPYTQADIGTHTYEVYEVVPEDAEDNKLGAITYSTKIYEVVVEVTDAGAGNLDAKIVSVDGAPLAEGEEAEFTFRFTNEYHASGSMPAAGRKLVNSKELTAEQIERLNKLVEFQLLQVENDGTITTLDSESLDEYGEFRFMAESLDENGELVPEDILRYTETDIGNTYTYQMKEHQIADDDEMGGYKVDNTVHVFKVKVEDGDNHDGYLKLTVMDADGNVIENAQMLDATFDNELTVEFHVNKTEVGDNSKEVAGAELTVYEVTTDENGEKKLTAVEGASWTSKENETHDFGDKLEEGKSYVLRETVAPDGYAYTTDIEFSVTDNGEIETDMPKTTDENGETVYLVEDAPLHFHVNKTEVGDNSKEVAGAEITVYELTTDEEGNTVETEVGKWVSAENETHDFGDKLKAGGKYVMRETVAPDGYAYTNDIEFSIDKNGTVTTDAQSVTGENGETVYLVEDAPLHFHVNKTEVGDNSKEVAGAEITVYELTTDEEGNTVETEVGKWVSAENETHDFGDKLKAGGRYVMRETVAPDGYAYTNDIEFTIDKDGTVTTDAQTVTDEEGNTVYLVEDAPLHFHVNKTEVGDNSKEVAGAEITVYEITTDENGNTVETKVDSWTSKEGETHDFGDKLKAGGRYVMRETVAPDGYAYTNDIEFTIGEDGTVTTEAQSVTGENGETVYLVEDAPITGSVTLRKTSETTGDLLSGAAFQLYYRTDGTESGWAPYNNASYTTDIDGTLTVSGLPANDYYFVETQAPEGFVTGTDENGEPKQYPFTVGLDETDRTKAEITVELGVTNAPEAVDTNLVVTKQLVYNNELWNAVDATFYVALYDDAGLTNRVSEIQPIEFRNMNTSSTTFEKLEVGKTYYVGETNKDGIVLNNLGGALATGEMFMVDFYNDNVVTIERGDGTQTVYFRNQFTELPREFYREGELTVTKQLLNAGGALQPSNETFYAGIFADAELTTLSKDVSKNIVPLPMNGLAMVSDIVKVTVPEGGRTTVYVAEVDAAGNPVAGAASFQYDVTVDGAVVTMDEENLKGSVVITNQEREKESEAETEEEETEVYREKSEETEEFVVPSSTKSVKTGDETPIMLYVGLLAAAALLLILALVLKRRKRG